MELSNLPQVFFGGVGMLLPVNMIKTKVAFMEGRLLSSQSEQSEKFSNFLEKKKAPPPKKPLLF